MRQHTHLPAMVRFVRNHVAQHFRANWPRPSPAVSEKLFDTAFTTAKRFAEHLRAASGAFGQSRAGLPRCAVCAVELPRNLQVRSCKSDPLAPNVVQVRENRRNAADLPRRFGSPGSRVKVFDKHLVDAIIGRKDPRCGSAHLRLNLSSPNLGSTCSHDSCSLTNNTSASSAALNFLSAIRVASRMEQVDVATKAYH